MISTAQVVEDYLDGEARHMASSGTIGRLLDEHGLGPWAVDEYRLLAIADDKVNNLGHLLVWLGY